MKILGKITLFILLAGFPWATSAAPLVYAPAPPDNPLKGFVPYPGNRGDFPHSLEWDYTKLSELMTGPKTFNWAPLDAKLKAAASRGCQFYTRFYMEWPGRETGVPQFLVKDGLKMHAWTNTNTQPNAPAIDHTPDYEDPRLRTALTDFIHALGARYDGDPRLGFIGLGLLGTWGEWHNYPNEQWFASKTVQREVMDAYEAAFKKTRLVARYPAGSDHYRYADNSRRAFGYHDDSFAWATVDTGKKQDDWFFETLLRNAGAADKWRHQPIGGEVRPEVWDGLFSEPSTVPKGQEFDRCLAVTHVSWLCNEGVFRDGLGPDAKKRAIKAAQRMGYEIHVKDAIVGAANGQLNVTLSVTNTGAAPFYYDWPVKLIAINSTGAQVAHWTADWALRRVQPEEAPLSWQHSANIADLPAGSYKVLLGVPNPMSGGKPVRFANETQDADLPGWLTLGDFKR